MMFDHLRLSCDAVKLENNTNMLVEQYALIHMSSGNDQGVRLLEHER